jgi:large subunit ribosomal protein L18
MSFKVNKEYRRLKIKQRVRKVISGSVERPRMTVFRSNKDIYVQLVDDNKGVTLASASSRIKEISDQKVTKIEKAKLVGKLIAERALENGINAVVFDRNGYLYHGRIKALADSAREGGIKF